MGVPLIASLFLFAPAERAGWVEQHPVVRVALADQGPFAFRGADGKLVGLSVDYLQLIAQSTGIAFETHLAVNVSDAIAGVQDGRFDAVMGIGRTEERETMLLFGKPYAFSPDAIVTRTDTPYMFDLRELAGKRVGIARSSKEVAEELGTNVPSAEVVVYDSMTDAVSAVSSGEVFVAVTDASVAAFAVQQRRLNNLRIAGVFHSPADVFLGIRKDWAPLVQIVDTAMSAIPAAEHTRLTNQWMALDYESDRRWQRAFLIISFALALGCGFIGLLVLFVRRLKRVQAQLEKTAAALELIGDEKSELLRMVAHDLRNPLTSLLINTQILAEGESDRETLSDMLASIASMQALIALLVDQQAMEAGRRAWTWTQIEPGNETVAAVQSVSDAAKKKNIRVEVHSEPGLPGLSSDRSAFRQLIDNLVSNAVKYSPPGAVVKVALSQTEHALRISVQDEGPGVPPEERTTIFTKYGVGTAKPTGGESSTGLGLWIVSRIVEQMRGRTGCSGEPGEGAVFWVELPY